MNLEPTHSLNNVDNVILHNVEIAVEKRHFISRSYQHIQKNIWIFS